MIFRVYGHATVTVAIYVEADTESEAYEIAKSERTRLNEYAVNGEIGKMVGVDGKGESVSADGVIEYDALDVIE